MACSRPGGGPSGPQINVTPLIDVLLTLIIMFMLVAAMDPEFGERVRIRAIEATVVMQVVWTTKDVLPSVKINQEDVRGENLEVRLAHIYLKRAEKVAFVRGDADVDFQYVAEVIDVAHQGGVQRVGLLTVEQTVGD